MNNKTPFLHAVLFAVLLACSTAWAEAPPELLDIQFAVQSASSEQVKIKLNGSYIPKAFILKDETPRIVFDFTDVKQGGKVNSSTAANGTLVKRIRVGMHTENQLKTRVVLDMATLSGVRYTHSFDEKTHTLLVTVTRGGEGQAETAPAAKKSPEKAGQAIASATPPTEKPEGTPALQAAPEQPAPPAEKPVAAKEEKTSSLPADQTSPVKKEAAESKTASPQKPTEPMSEKPVEPTAPPAPSADAQLKTASVPPADSSAEKPGQQQEKQNKATPPQLGAPAKETTSQEPAAPADDAAKKEAAPTVPPVPAQTGAKQEEPSKAVNNEPIIESIQFDGKSPKGEMVLFKLNDFHPPAIHGVEEGIPRVICDFDKAQLASSIKNLIKTEGKFVKVIRVAKNKKPERVRVIIDLEPKQSYDLQQVFFKEDKLFVIIVNTMKK